MEPFPVNLSSHKRDPPSDKDSFQKTVTHGESHRTFTSPPQTAFPYILLWNLFFLLPPHFFFIRTLQTPLQKINKISIDFKKPPHRFFFCFKENSLFWRCLIFSPHTYPKGTCSFNKPQCSSLNKIRSSTELFIKNFFLLWSPHFSGFELPNYNPLKKVHATSTTHCPLPPPPIQVQETHEPNCQ